MRRERSQCANPLLSGKTSTQAIGRNAALFSSAFTSRNAQTFASFILASRGTRDIDFNLAAVNTLIAIGPPVILSFFFQRYLESMRISGVGRGDGPGDRR